MIQRAFQLCFILIAICCGAIHKDIDLQIVSSNTKILKNEFIQSIEVGRLGFHLGNVGLGFTVAEAWFSNADKGVTFIDTTDKNAVPIVSKPRSYNFSLLIPDMRIYPLIIQPGENKALSIYCFTKGNLITTGFYPLYEAIDDSGEAVENIQTYNIAAEVGATLNYSLFKKKRELGMFEVDLSYGYRFSKNSFVLTKSDDYEILNNSSKKSPFFSLNVKWGISFLSFMGQKKVPPTTRPSFFLSYKDIPQRKAGKTQKKNIRHDKQTLNRARKRNHIDSTLAIIETLKTATYIDSAQILYDSQLWTKSTQENTTVSFEEYLADTIGERTHSKEAKRLLESFYLETLLTAQSFKSYDTYISRCKQRRITPTEKSQTVLETLLRALRDKANTSLLISDIENYVNSCRKYSKASSEISAIAMRALTKMLQTQSFSIESYAEAKAKILPHIQEKGPAWAMLEEALRGYILNTGENTDTYITDIGIFIKSQVPQKTYKDVLDFILLSKLSNQKEKQFECLFELSKQDINRELLEQYTQKLFNPETYRDYIYTVSLLKLCNSSSIDQIPSLPALTASGRFLRSFAGSGIHTFKDGEKPIEHKDENNFFLRRYCDVFSQAESEELSPLLKRVVSYMIENNMYTKKIEQTNRVYRSKEIHEGIMHVNDWPIESYRTTLKLSDILNIPNSELIRIFDK